MRLLVTWGSKRGGTEGIARTLGEALRGEGIDVELLPAAQAMRASGFDAVVVGGALYANRWHRDARRFVSRRAKWLRTVPVWLFSSGPLDDSAAGGAIAPTKDVAALMDRVGAQDHVTFGGRLAPDARGFPASAMARKHSGDWRDPSRIRRWGETIARALPAARPRPAVALPGRSIARLLTHVAAGWAMCAIVMATLLTVTSAGVAIAVHAFVVPIVFAVVAARYFGARGSREPLATALVFSGVVAALDLVIAAALVQRSFAMFGSVGGFWLPLALIFVVTFAVGSVMAMMPPRAQPTPPGRAATT